jgi:hypothetical protein
MYIDITWKIALPALIGLFVIATVVMNSSSAKSRGVPRDAAVGLVGCRIHDSLSPCFNGSLGYPAGDLFVEYFH